MNEINTKLRHTIKSIQSQIEADNACALDKLKRISDTYPYMVLLTDFATNKITYVNASAAQFFGFDKLIVENEGITFSTTLLESENSHLGAVETAFFENKANRQQQYEFIYLVKTPLEKKWVYACAQIATFQSDGSPCFILNTFCDINNIIREEENEFEDKNTIKSGTIIPKWELYKKLTEREKEILYFISKEYTTNEIADILLIGKATVDSHRKHLLRKLNVKNAIGLAKYAIYFNYM